MHCFLDRVHWARLATAVAGLLVGVSHAAVADTLSVSWDPSRSTDVAGYRVYVGTTEGLYSRVVDVGPATAWDFTEAVPGKRYCFAVSSYSVESVEGGKSAAVCGFSDRLTVLTNPGPQATVVGQYTTLQIQGSDPDGLPVTFSATGLPPGLSIRNSTGFIEGTPTTAGVYSVTIGVTDGVLLVTEAFVWTVHAGLQAPVLVSPSNTSTTVLPTFVWQAVANATGYHLAVDDAGEGDPISLNVTREQAGCATSTGSCRAILSTPLQLGVASWTVRASNASVNGPWAAARTFTTGDSTAPTISIASPTTSSTFSIGAPTVALGGTAADSGGVTEVRWVNDRGGSGTAQGTVSWRVPSVPLRPGANKLTVLALDGSGNQTATTLLVTATDTGAPTVEIESPTAESRLQTEGTSLRLSGRARDDFGVTRVSWVNHRGGGGTATGTGDWVAVVELRQGANTLTITAADESGNRGTDTLTVVADTTPSTANIAEAQMLTASIAGTSGGPAPVSTSAVTVPQPVSVSTTAVTLPEPVSAPTTPATPAAPAPTVRAASAQAQQQSAVPPRRAQGAVPPQRTESRTSPMRLSEPQPQLMTSAIPRLDIPQAPADPPPPVAPPRPAVARTVSSEPPPAFYDYPQPDAPRAESLLDPTYTAPRRTPPRIVIAEPAAGRYTTTAARVTVSGLASLPGGVSAVTWSSANAAGGQALGTEAWRIDDLPLVRGTNLITVTASDGGSEIVTAQLVVVRTEPLGVSITKPATAAKLTTSEGAVALAGTATGNVTTVTWAADWGGSGTASGTKAWRIDAVGLERGVNVITITARDAEGGVARRVLTITSNPPARRSRNR
jgi:hypothetical protein